MLSEYFFCDERYGPKWRHVREVTPTPEVEAYLRSRLPHPDKSPMKDIAHIYSPGARLFLVDDVGLMLKGCFQSGGLYDVHIGFWDLVLRGRELMCRAMARRVAEDAGARGVWTAIPIEARATLAFAKRVGFIEQSQSSQSGSVSVLTLLVT